MFDISVVYDVCMIILSENYIQVVLISYIPAFILPQKLRHLSFRADFLSPACPLIHPEVRCSYIFMLMCCNSDEPQELASHIAKRWNDSRQNRKRLSKTPAQKINLNKTIKSMFLNTVKIDLYFTIRNIWEIFRTLSNYVKLLLFVQKNSSVYTFANQHTIAVYYLVILEV